MKITYTIVKKRGFWRPVLTYTCEKEGWEVELRVPGGEVEHTTAPEALDWHPYARDLKTVKNERRFEVEGSHWKNLRLPTAEEKEYTSSIVLPWRPGARPEYPEVEASLQALRAAWEERVQQALASESMDVSGEVEPSPEYKKAVAPYVAARRMLGGQM